MLMDYSLARFKHLMASYKILLALLCPRSFDIPFERLEPYTIPPPPAFNPYIKRREDTSVTQPTESDSSPNIKGSAARSPPKHVSSIRLMRPLLAARTDATHALVEFLREVERNNWEGKGEVVEYLRFKGARI